MREPLEWVRQTIGSNTTLCIKLLGSLVVVSALSLLRLLVLSAARRRHQDAQVRHRWRKTLTYVVGILGLFLVG